MCFDENKPRKINGFFFCLKDQMQGINEFSTSLEGLEKFLKKNEETQIIHQNPYIGFDDVRVHTNNAMNQFLFVIKSTCFKYDQSGKKGAISSF